MIVCCAEILPRKCTAFIRNRDPLQWRRSRYSQKREKVQRTVQQNQAKRAELCPQNRGHESQPRAGQVHWPGDQPEVVVKPKEEIEKTKMYIFCHLYICNVVTLFCFHELKISIFLLLIAFFLFSNILLLKYFWAFLLVLFALYLLIFFICNKLYFC